VTSAVSDWEIGRREGELPEGWSSATLEEIVVHALGGVWGEEAGKSSAGVEVRVIRGKEFRDWGSDRATRAPRRVIGAASLAKRRLAAGDLVIEISGGGVGQPVGRALLIDQEALERADLPLVCSNFCRQMRVHREIDPAYVLLVLESCYLSGSLDELQTQTTNIRNLKFSKFLSSVVVPLPPRAEQERIVARATEAFARVQGARQRLARLPEILRRLRQSVLTRAFSGELTEEWRRQELSGAAAEPLAERLEGVFARRREAWEMACVEAEAFDRRAPRRPKNLHRSQWEAPEPLVPPEVPEGWSVFPLLDLTQRIQYGLSTRADAGERDGVAILRMSNIQNGRLDPSGLKYIDPREVDVPAYRVRRGDVLFNRTNSPELVGKAAVFDLDLEAVFASYVVRIEGDERLIDSRYLCAWINSPWGRSWARTVRTQSVGQSNINVSRLQTLPVPAPPLAEQREIVRRLEEQFAQAARIERHVMAAAAGADKLWRTILGRALRGELVVTEAELARGEARDYEPASDLLERVSAEKLAGPPDGAPALLAEKDVAEPILAALRQSCWGAGPMTREELILRMAARLEWSPFNKVMRAQLERHIEVALARRIIARDIAREGELLTGATPQFGRYDFGFLMATIERLAPPGSEVDKGEIVRALAAYLGYGQVTSAIRERMDRVFLWAAHDGRVEIRGDRVALPPFP
jgi:type I restriction enzyme S subunit